MMTKMLSPSEVARQIGVTRTAVARVARKMNVGVVAGGRLVALSKGDAEKLKKNIYPRPGKPPCRQSVG